MLSVCFTSCVGDMAIPGAAVAAHGGGGGGGGRGGGWGGGGMHYSAQATAAVPVIAGHRPGTLFTRATPTSHMRVTRTSVPRTMPTIGTAIGPITTGAITTGAITTGTITSITATGDLGAAGVGVGAGAIRGAPGCPGAIHSAGAATMPIICAPTAFTIRTPTQLPRTCTTMPMTARTRGLPPAIN